MKKADKPTLKDDGYEFCCGYRIRQVDTSAGKRYQVDLGRKSGRHVRKSFELIKDARIWANKKSTEAANKGIKALRFSDDQKTDAVEALELLNKYGVNLRAAAAYYVKHHQEVNEKNGVGALIEEYLTEQKKRVERKELRIRSYEDAQKRLKPFSDAMGHLSIDTIEAKQIDVVMDECGFQETNRQNYKRYLSGFYIWAVRNRKTTINVVKETRKIKIASHTPEVYSPDQVQKIMDKAEELHPELAPYLAVAFFAGVRPEEITRLNWEDIDFELGEIHIRSQQSKTSLARLVGIQPNLKTWLIKYRRKAGPVFPYSATSLQRWRAKVHREVGVTPIQDGARHSFATYYLALNTLDDTLQELGHSSPKMLFKHYRGLAKNRKGQARQYFKIRPEKQKA